jgi:ABC-type lipoprotein release transport system permease subunit
MQYNDSGKGLFALQEQNTFFFSRIYIYIVFVFFFLVSICGLSCFLIIF